MLFPRLCYYFFSMMFLCFLLFVWCPDASLYPVTLGPLSLDHIFALTKEWLTLNFLLTLSDVQCEQNEKRGGQDHLGG